MEELGKITKNKDVSLETKASEALSLQFYLFKNKKKYINL